MSRSDKLPSSVLKYYYGPIVSFVPFQTPATKNITVSEDHPMNMPTKVVSN
jgi:hypothetical protein